MNVFFSDLDNTLIFSHRKTLPEGRVPVERLDGRDQSFMTPYAFSFFRALDWLDLVPVTTRSEAQYRRLSLPCPVRFALVCNGGKLLAGGAEDPRWTEETLALARDALPALEQLGEQLRDLCGGEVHTPEPYYFYAKSDDPEKLCALLARQDPPGSVRIARDSRKVYLFPACVNKGAAVRRFLARFGPARAVSAGDGLMDVPMLNETDFSLAPAELCGLLRGSPAALGPEAPLSDLVCRELERLRAQGIL